jgi:DNA-3-methyladenine glycosylase
MQTHRGQQSITSLANGPAKLVQACQISPSENGQTVLQAPTYITSPLSARQHPLPDAEIVTTTRVGITKAATEKLRFYIKNSQFISKK